MKICFCKLLVGSLLLTVSATPVVANTELRGEQGMAALLEKVQDEVGQSGEDNQFYLKAERRHHVESGEAAMCINRSVAEISLQQRFPSSGGA